MCWFIKVLLPVDTDFKGLEPICQKYIKGLHEYDGEKGLRVHRPTDKIFMPTLHPMCDCDSALGSWEHMAKYWKRQGKEPPESMTIESMLQDSEIKHSDGSISIKKNDIPLWKNFIKESLENKLATQIGLLIHWEDEITPLAVKEVRRVPIKDITEKLLLRMEVDVLYEFVRD